MNNLWSEIPPLGSDIFGFRTVVDATDGIGIIDDASNYKPRGFRRGGRGDRGGGGDRGGRHGEHGGRHGGEHERHGGYGGRGGMQGRILSTGIRMDDIAFGTREAILRAFENAGADGAFSFVLLTMAPCASMIGTDMDEAARMIAEESGKPCAFVDINGHQTYDVGISVTLETMARLLLGEQGEAGPVRVASGINILGGTEMDWGADGVKGVIGWCEAAGLPVLSKWGIGDTADVLRRAPAAEVNLVTTASGLATARYMKAEFGIPYIAAAPFGAAWSGMVKEGLRTKTQPTVTPRGGSQRFLVITEQFAANAIRATLRTEYGAGDVTVASFSDMDVEYLQEGDVRVTGESGLRELLRASEGATVIADANYRRLAPASAAWIDLPSSGGFQPPQEPAPSLAAAALNEWLDRAL